MIGISVNKPKDYRCGSGEKDFRLSSKKMEISFGSVTTEDGERVPWLSIHFQEYDILFDAYGDEFLELEGASGPVDAYVKAMRLLFKHMQPEYFGRLCSEVYEKGIRDGKKSIQSDLKALLNI